jgi:putative DNA primase/helicase
MKHPDINDTVRAHGPNAVRVRHDRAHQQRQQREQRSGATPPRILPPPSEPMQVAREFVGRCCLNDDSPDALTLRFWNGGWWAWRTSHWAEVENRAVRSLLYAFTEYALYPQGKKLLTWSPTRRKIGDLLEALSAICILTDEIEQPC